MLARMMGPKIKTVFRSRWNAIFWSLSVLLTAYCSVPSPDQTKPAGTVDKAQAQSDQIQSEQQLKAEQAALAPFLGQPSQPKDDHVNPWAKTPQG